ncbi:hypothetical protein WOLCODRAFT_155307 [Wolfiporia cocos MD-104 SS10]|uniref:HAT C-terminal dimerisation domain-containing protein n=1 Tax=Wolfiporia cocos (strain MD-104) TaxID=742152 RepID=A0A2H3IXH2_WOLCO|nr:hypothetical protein WOLCODRAFT_155307 [Wolfiporia cocos MD-104 SS10]
MGITRRLYLHVFQLDVPLPDLIHEVYDYAERKNRYSPDCWPIEDLRRRRDNPSEVDCNVDPISAWTIISQDSSLVKLAILVLSFVPNSASTERLFSSMGHTKTKMCSRLGIQKNRDIAFLKMELRRRHAEEGTARKRLKQRFGNTETSVDCDKSGSRLSDEQLLQEAEGCSLSSSNDDSDEEGADNEAETDNKAETGEASEHPKCSQFLKSVQALEAAANVDSDDEDVGGVVEQAASDGSMRRASAIIIRCFFGQKYLFTIHELFNWSIEAGWDEFWTQGVRNYREEVVFYELMSRVHEDSPQSSSTAITKYSDAAPIVVDSD